MAKLKVEHLDFSIDKAQILKAIDLKIQKGEFVGLVGPNGCGKSTLLKNIYRIYQPDRGKIYLDGQLVDQVNDKEFAKKMAVMVQENTVEFDLTVIDMVMLGRYAHKRLLQDSSEKDHAIAEKYLEEVGEKQRVLLARALSQEAELIILDEPTNHLDIKYQYQIMNILKRQDMTVFTSVHDLNIASLYCDRIVVLKKGDLVKIGTPEEVITPEMIHYLYGIDSEVRINKTTGRPQIQFLPNFNV